MDFQSFVLLQLEPNLTAQFPKIQRYSGDIPTKVAACLRTHDEMSGFDLALNLFA